MPSDTTPTPTTAVTRTWTTADIALWYRLPESERSAVTNAAERMYPYCIILADGEDDATVEACMSSLTSLARAVHSIILQIGEKEWRERGVVIDLREVTS